MLAPPPRPVYALLADGSTVLIRPPAHETTASQSSPPWCWRGTPPCCGYSQVPGSRSGAGSSTG